MNKRKIGAIMSTALLFVAAAYFITDSAAWNAKRIDNPKGTDIDKTPSVSEVGPPTEFEPTYEEVMGFYSLQSRTISYDGSEPYTYECDTFVVNNGDGMAVREMIRLVESGNTVNQVTPDGKLRFNLDLNALSIDQKNKIRNSDSTASITISITLKQQEGKGGTPCSSFVIIQKE